MTTNSPEDVSNIPEDEINRQLGDYFKTAVEEIDRLTGENSENNRKIMQALKKQVVNNELLTANPSMPDNNEYETTSSLDVKDYLKSRLTGKVLDIGFGGKEELKGIVDEDVVYIDKDTYPVENSVQSDAEKLPFLNNSFDSLYSRNSVHLNPRLMLPETLRVLKPGGTLVLAISEATGYGMKANLLRTLNVLSELGINIATNCELTVNNNLLQHKSLPLHINQPEILFTVHN